MALYMFGLGLAPALLFGGHGKEGDVAREIEFPAVVVAVEIALAEVRGV